MIILSHLGHCWAKLAGAAPKGVIASILRNGLEPAKTPILRQVFVFDSNPFWLWESSMALGDQIILKLTTLKLLGPVKSL